MSNIGWSAFISDVYSAEERNTVQGKFASIGGVGRIVGALLGGALYDGLGRAYPGWGFKEGGIFFVSAFVMAVSVVPLLFMPEGGVAFRDTEKGAGGAEGPSLKIAASRPLRSSASASASVTGEAGRELRVFVVFLVAMLLMNSGINTLGAFRGQYLDLAEGFAASARTISLVVNVESAALIATGFFVGALGRRLGIKALLVLGASAGVVSLIGHAAARDLSLIYAAAAFKGLSDGCVLASSYAFASTLIPPGKRGRYFAVYNSTFFLSWGLSATFLTGPLIDGLIRAGKGSVYAYRAGLGSGAVLMTIGLALLVALFAATRRGDSRRSAGP
jgi:UMF1 family MFS transporter